MSLKKKKKRGNKWERKNGFKQLRPARKKKCLKEMGQGREGGKLENNRCDGGRDQRGTYKKKGETIKRGVHLGKTGSRWETSQGKNTRKGGVSW